MVKARGAKVKARPLPNRFSIRVDDAGGISSIRKLAAQSGGGGGSVTRRTSGREDDSSTHSEVANGSSGTQTFGATGRVPDRKRPIFPHLTRLQHGVLRYRNVQESPTSVAGVASSTDRDRRFVFVPAGYSIQNDQSMREILITLGLPNLPPLVIVTASTDGALEESLDEEGRPDFPKLAPPTDLEHLSEDEERELLKEKTQEILKSTVELCGETGAWLLPHRPRRANGAAEILCSVVHPTEGESSSNAITKKAVILGMIGLDQQDQQGGFTTIITNHMVPVGSEVEAIADVPYDPNLRDHTPCPELTHLLLFQRRQEMRAFRERLLAQTPDLFLAFGSTTPYAKKCMFSTLVTKSPVALVTHTSREIDHMSWLLRHADRELQKIQVGQTEPPELGTSTYAVSGEATTFATQPLAPLPDLEDADPELASFLPMWPAGHDDERVVLADPRRVGGERFQQLLLRAVNASFYIREARIVAIRESNVVLESIQVSAEEVKVVTERYHLGMVLATLAAVAAAVFYAKIYGDMPPPSFENRNPYQIALFLLTLGLPLLIVILKKRYDDNSQLWSSIQREAANLESILASFRTRPRTYGQSASSQEPLDAFVSDVCSIYASVMRLLGTDERDRVGSDGTIEEPPRPNHAIDIEAPPPSESSPLLDSTRSAPSVPAPSRSTLEDLALRGSTSRWKKTSIATTVDSGSEATERDPSQGIDNGDKTRYLDLDSYQKHAMTTEEGSEGEEAAAAASTLDDKDLIWAIQEYIDDRIHAVRQQKDTQLQVLEQRNNLMEVIIKVILASTTLMALLSKQWAIPIVLGVSASFVSSQDFRKYRKRVDQGQSMIQQLDELLSWWEGLDTEDKILASNEDRLVLTAEGIIAADVAFTY